MMFALPTNIHNKIRIALYVLVFISLFLLITWPLFAGRNVLAVASENQIQLVIAILIPLALLLTLNDTLSHTVSVRSFALIAIFVSLAVALRPLGLGVAGLEPIWVAIIMAGYTLGMSCGFIVGGLSLLLSALVTGGVGPWLGNQMVLAAFIGAGAGFIGMVSVQRIVITLYAAGATYVYGWFMNLWFWPTFSNLQSGIGFDSQSSIIERVLAWAKFSLLTSTGFDIPRSLLSAILIWLVAPRIRSAVNRLNAPFSTKS